MTDKEKLDKMSQGLIETFERALERYKKELEKNPDSTFYKGLVKETEEYLKEIKLQTDALNKTNNN